MVVAVVECVESTALLLCGEEAAEAEADGAGGEGGSTVIVDGLAKLLGASAEPPAGECSRGGSMECGRVKTGGE